MVYDLATYMSGSDFAIVISHNPASYLTEDRTCYPKRIAPSIFNRSDSNNASVMFLAVAALSSTMSQSQ